MLTRLLMTLSLCWASTLAAPDALQERALPAAPGDYNFSHSPDIGCGDEEVNLSYKVPLTAAQEQRAQRLYRNSLVILAHVHCVETWDFTEMQRTGISAVILKVDTDGVNMVGGTRALNRKDEIWVPRATRSLSRIHELAKDPASKVLIARSTKDIERAKREGKVAIILSFEGAKPLLGKIDNLKRYFDLGLRELQLWWAVPNELKTPDNRQFSAFGEEVIRQMNSMGIVIDLSHITGQAFGRALELTKDPVIISHAGVGALYIDPKNPSANNNPTGQALSGTDHLNDAAIKAMAANGGAICVHFVTPAYISAKHGTPKATVVDLVDHIAYIRDLVGIDTVALGSDYFPEKGWDWIDGVGRMSLLMNVAREMVRRDFTDQQIEKVLGGNLMRVFNKVWK